MESDSLTLKVDGLYNAGMYAEALPLAQKAVELSEKVLGPDHPDVAATLNNLAALYHDMGDYAKAEPLYRRALGIREKALGPDHPDVAATLNNLAALYHDMGDYAKAEPLYRRALAIYEKALGPDHPYVAASLNNLAALYWAMGDYAKAEPLYHRALAIYEKALGPDHPSVATALNNLSALYRAMGDYAKAEPLIHRALAIYEKALGPDHPDVATSRNNLAALYDAMGDYAKAEPLYRRALAIDENVLGPEHPRVALALDNLAALYDSMGDHTKAELLYQRALAIREKALAPRLYILAVGINRYGGELPRLALAAKDATDFASELGRVGRAGFERVSTHLLLDEEASRAPILSAIREILSKARPQDTFVFFYSGLGGMSERLPPYPFTLESYTKPPFYLFPSDVRDASEAETKGISAIALQSWLSKIETHHQLIILDTSLSDHVIQTLIAPIDKENKELESYVRRDMVILANAGYGVESPDLENGLLTRVVLEGLTGGAARENGEVTAQRLVTYVQVGRDRLLQQERPDKQFLQEHSLITTYSTGADFSLGYVARKKTGSKGNDLLDGVPVAQSLSLHDQAEVLRVATALSQSDFSQMLLQPMPESFVQRESATYLPFSYAQQETSHQQTQISGTEEPPKVKVDRSIKGKDYAVLFAGNNYDHWPTLRNPVVDASAILDELKMYYGFEDVQLVPNPTKTSMLDKLVEYKHKTYSEHDQLFIFIAGHGHFNEELEEGFIIASDSDPKIVDVYGRSFIAHSILRKVIDKIPAKHIFLVIDACFSGTIDEFIVRNRAGDIYAEATNPEFIKRKLRFKTRQFLTSGGKEYVPDGRPGQHSPFARKLLEALRSYGGQHGVLTINGILSYVERTKPEPRKGEWGGNEPGSDFVFIARPPSEATKPSP